MSGDFDRSTVYKINNTLQSNIQTSFYIIRNAQKYTFFVTSGCNNVPITSGTYVIHNSNTLHFELQPRFLCHQVYLHHLLHYSKCASNLQYPSRKIIHILLTQWTALFESSCWGNRTFLAKSPFVLMDHTVIVGKLSSWIYFLLLALAYRSFLPLLACCKVLTQDGVQNTISVGHIALEQFLTVFHYRWHP
jgi:hypothetical protein